MVSDQGIYSTHPKEVKTKKANSVDPDEMAHYTVCNALFPVNSVEFVSYEDSVRGHVNAEVLLMSNRNMCFYGEMKKIIP